MARGKLRPDIHQEIKTVLRDKERFGQKKYLDKQDGSYLGGIYSTSTAKTYNKECQRFGEYVQQHGIHGRFTTLEEARELAKEYIQSQVGVYSASTVKLRASALGKLYGCSTAEFGPTESRRRQDITRSRQQYVESEKTGKMIKNKSTAFGNFSEKNHAAEVNFGRSTGLRREEMELIRGDQLVFDVEKGRYYIHVTDNQAKGGRDRMAPVIGSPEEIQKVVDQCQAAGDQPVWGKLPDHMDEHMYRRQYATAYYNQIARDPRNLDPKDRYCCRGDLKGVWYDRKAMLEVSRALGHNRINVIAGHYLES